MRRSAETHTHTHLALTSELDLSLVVAIDDGVGARRLTPVETGVQLLHLRYLQLHLVVLEPHHRNVARRHALAERRVGVGGVKGGDYLNPLPVGIPGHHPLEILQDGGGDDNDWCDEKVARPRLVAKFLFHLYVT